jgi:hypothetical protein
LIFRLRAAAADMSIFGIIAQQPKTWPLSLRALIR